MLRNNKESGETTRYRGEAPAPASEFFNGSITCCPRKNFCYIKEGRRDSTSQRKDAISNQTMQRTATATRIAMMLKSMSRPIPMLLAIRQAIEGSMQAVYTIEGREINKERVA